jgi:hypothetical protein
MLRDSLILSLQNIYPDVHWQPWKFFRVPNHYWESISNQRCRYRMHHMLYSFFREFFECLSNELKINNIDDWYGVHIDSIRQLGGGGLIDKYYKVILLHHIVKYYNIGIVLYNDMSYQSVIIFH